MEKSKITVDLDLEKHVQSFEIGEDSYEISIKKNTKPKPNRKMEEKDINCLLEIFREVKNIKPIQINAKIHGDFYIKFEVYFLFLQDNIGANAYRNKYEFYLLEEVKTDDYYDRENYNLTVKDTEILFNILNDLYIGYDIFQKIFQKIEVVKIIEKKLKKFEQTVNKIGNKYGSNNFMSLFEEKNEKRFFKRINNLYLK